VALAKLLPMITGFLSFGDNVRALACTHGIVAFVCTSFPLMLAAFAICLIVYALARTWFAFTCETHIWNSSTGCVAA